MKSTWRSRLPEDEIARQQRIKELLQPGCKVKIKGMGEFVFWGVWDTMHCFVPLAGNRSLEVEAAVEAAVDAAADILRNPRYRRRGMNGAMQLQLPYTLLADTIEIL